MATATIPCAAFWTGLSVLRIGGEGHESFEIEHYEDGVPTERFIVMTRTQAEEVRDALTTLLAGEEERERRPGSTTRRA
jgi:hypothetical protein